jgi:hypothetical protein
MSDTERTAFDHLATDTVFTAKFSPVTPSSKVQEAFVRQFQFSRIAPHLTVEATDMSTGTPTLIVWSHFWNCWTVNREQTRMEVVIDQANAPRP